MNYLSEMLNMPIIDKKNGTLYRIKNVILDTKFTQIQMFVFSSESSYEEYVIKTTDITARGKDALVFEGLISESSLYKSRIFTLIGAGVYNLAGFHLGNVKDIELQELLVNAVNMDNEYMLYPQDIVTFGDKLIVTNHRLEDLKKNSN